MADPDGDSPRPRTRTVSCDVSLDVRQQAELVWSVAVAEGPELASEQLTVTVDDSPVPVEELRVEDGGRLHVCTAPPGRSRSEMTRPAARVPNTVTDADDGENGPGRASDRLVAMNAGKRGSIGVSNSPSTSSMRREVQTGTRRN